ncbi:septum site-determining protein Ssd [Nocardia uniformis]|uniref:septum site-determining protein Ssd n=1 Tax=Nocardia uniformis TaxID=53432 RepID=UPI0008296032|nr:septum site-determining protein Ssd [Nocardia uniformis]
MNSDIAATPALLLVDEPRLRDEIRRIAAAADRRLEERALPIGRHTWLGAALVLVDSAAARACAAIGCPRRPGVVLVTDGEPGLLDWQTATAIGAEQVLALPDSAESLIAAFAAHARRAIGNGVVIAVAGACGGAGASTLSAAIALTAAAHHFRERTLLLDAAPFGGGLDLLLGIEKAPGLRWPDLAIEHGRVAAEALHAALPATRGVTVLACARTTSMPALRPPAVRAVLESARTAGDLLICDLSNDRGPHTDQLLDAADLVVMVVPATLRATAAAEPVAAHLVHRNPNVALTIRGPSPGGLRPPDIAAVLNLPLLHAMRPQPGLARRLERTGLSVRRHTPLHRAAESVLTVLASPDTAHGELSHACRRHSGYSRMPTDAGTGTGGGAGAGMGTDAGAWMGTGAAMGTGACSGMGTDNHNDIDTGASAGSEALRRGDGNRTGPAPTRRGDPGEVLGRPNHGVSRADRSETLRSGGQERSSTAHRDESFGAVAGVRA